LQNDLLQRLQLLARLETNCLARRNRDLCASARIAADPGLARTNVENPKAPKLDPFTPAESALHAFKHGFDGHLRFRFGDARSIDYFVDDVQFDQSRSSPFPVTTRKPHDRIRVINLSSQPYLFVYGTLKSSFRNRYARRLRREALLAGRATMPGRLYRIRWYPGMRPACRPEDVVTGELYRLRQPGKTLEALDEYEDDYRRELNRATLETGQSFPAWVYIYRYHRREHCYIVSGEWPT
jgi:gamma-glutamylcyclotransferase (GGCT)/AIG2-like uncharacterized protein YtfP